MTLNDKKIIFSNNNKVENSNNRINCYNKQKLNKNIKTNILLIHLTPLTIINLNKNILIKIVKMKDSMKQRELFFKIQTQ